MSICLYDNPDTMRREAWQDGKLVAFVTANTLETKGFSGDKRMPFMLNAGRWKIGMFHHGDKSAMEESPS